MRKDLHLAAVADGMGGLPHGEDAAQTAIAALTAQLDRTVPADVVGWRALLGTINQEVVALGQQLSPTYGIGTTLTLVRVGADRLQFAHVGDSALMRLRNGQLEQLTCEHTMASEILSRRAAGFWQSMPANAAHVLTSCLGLPRLTETDVREADLQAGDRLLLCSDGLTKPVELQTIREALASAGSAAAAAQTLVDLANAEGGPDNITTVAIFVKEI